VVFLGAAFFGAGFGGALGTRCRIFQAHMTAGIQPIKVACMANAKKPPKGLSSAKIIAQGKNMAANESNVRFILIIFSCFWASKIILEKLF
jgi:hypothetical protein